MAERPTHLASPLSKRFVLTGHHRGQCGGLLCRSATYASALGNTVERRSAPHGQSRTTIRDRSERKYIGSVRNGCQSEESGQVLPREAAPHTAKSFLGLATENSAQASRRNLDGLCIRAALEAIGRTDMPPRPTCAMIGAIIRGTSTGSFGPRLFAMRLASTGL